MTYPDLKEYRNCFIAQGVSLPLRTIPDSIDKCPPQIEKQGIWPWTTVNTPEKYQVKGKWPRLSVIIPTYNQGQYIEEAIRSVIFQYYPNTELIVIDGGSTDNTKEILEKYSPWISFWQSEKDRGQTHAINLGLSIASGEYVGWLNSDDFYNEEGFYFIAIAILEKNRDFYYGDGSVTDEHRTWKKDVKLNYVHRRFLKFGGLIASHSTFWRHSKSLPLLEEMNIAMDYELWRRLVPTCTLYHIKKPIGCYRVQPEAKSLSEKWVDRWKRDDELLKTMYDIKVSRLESYIYKYYQKAYKFFNNG